MQQLVSNNMDMSDWLLPYNRSIEKLLDEDLTLKSQEQTTRLSAREVAILNAGLILDRDYIDFLSDIAFTAANDFYTSLDDIRVLLNQSASVNTRCDLAEEFLKHASQSVDATIKSVMSDTADPCADDSLLYHPADFYTFEAEAIEKNEHGQATKVPLGDFNLGRRPAINRYAKYYNHVIRMNIHEDAIKQSTPARQIYVVAHEQGHSVDEFVMYNTQTKMPLPSWLVDALNSTKNRFNYEASEEAYAHSVNERHAEYFGHTVKLFLMINLLQERASIQSACLETIGREISYSHFVIESIQARTKWNVQAQLCEPILERHIMHGSALN